MFVVYRGVFWGFWGKLWTMLLIMANHNESSVRFKASKAIHELCANSEHITW